MKNKCLVLLVFLTSLSLLLASLTSREQVEKVRADDYGTYIQPGSGIAHLASNTGQQIYDLPFLITHYIIGSIKLVCSLLPESLSEYRSYTAVSLYLSCRQFLI
jgi:hypothetical protein